MDMKISQDAYGITGNAVIEAPLGGLLSAS